MQNYDTDRPNLERVARRIAASRDPERTIDALGAVLAANEHQLYNVLNSCRKPRLIYRALLVLAESGALQELREAQTK